MFHLHWLRTCECGEGVIWITGEREQLPLIISFLEFAISQFPINELTMIHLCVQFCWWTRLQRRKPIRDSLVAISQEAWLYYSSFFYFILMLRTLTVFVVVIEGFLRQKKTLFTDHLKCIKRIAESSHAGLIILLQTELCKITVTHPHNLF